MLNIRFLIHLPVLRLTEVELLSAARNVLEAQYNIGNYSLSYTIHQGTLEATLVFETLIQDTAAARTTAMAVGTALKALGPRGVIILATPDVEFTVI